MKRLLVIAALLGGLLPGALAFAGPISAVSAAYNPLDKACSEPRAKESAACANTSQNAKITGADGVIIKVTRLMAAIAGLVAVIMIIVYGITLTTSYGDSGKATTARNGIIAAGVGLVVIVLAQAIVVFLVSNL